MARIQCPFIFALAAKCLLCLSESTARHSNVSCLPHGLVVESNCSMRLTLLMAIVCLEWAAAGLVATAAAAETNSAGEARFLSHIRQLTFQGRRSGEAYFSPDGKALILQ